MGKYEPKTRPTDESVEAFIDSVTEGQKRADAYRLLEIFGEITGEKPQMWGPAIIGYGSRHLKYASGQELDWPVAAFSPRKANLTLYVLSGSEKDEEYLAKLGKHTHGKSCLYIKRLADIDEGVLRSMIRESVKNASHTC